MKIKPILIGILLILCAGVVSSNAQIKNKKARPQTARILITEQGFTPYNLRFRRGSPVRITFLRKTDATCAKEVVIPAYGVNRSLPLNRAVVVSFTPKKAGEVSFTCGMNMMRGKLIIR